MPKPNHRDKILSSGLAVFHQQGFHGSGIQDIVNHAGVPKGSFYNHFESKDALGLEILNTYWEYGAKARKELENTDIPVLGRIQRYLDATVYDERGCLVGNFSGELSNSETFRSRLSELFDIWKNDLASVIHTGQQDGTIRSNDSAANMAEFFIIGLQGAMLKAKVDRDPDVLERFRNSIQLFLQKD